MGVHMNKRNEGGRLAWTVAALAAAVLLFGSCTSRGGENTAQTGAAAADPKYLDYFEGLHVTGTPIDIDVKTYRLEVTGKVEKPLSLSYQEVRKLKAAKEKIPLDCPGFFTDIGTWTGPTVRTILEKARVSPDAKTVIFTTVLSDYTTRFPIEEAMKNTMLVAYDFNGKAFHRVHGFPLRLVAGGKEGSDWIKWLGKITVE